MEETFLRGTDALFTLTGQVGGDARGWAVLWVRPEPPRVIQGPTRKVTAGSEQTWGIQNVLAQGRGAPCG